MLCLASDQPRAFDGCAWAWRTMCDLCRAPLCPCAFAEVLLEALEQTGCSETCGRRCTS